MSAVDRDKAIATIRTKRDETDQAAYDNNVAFGVRETLKLGFNESIGILRDMPDAKVEETEEERRNKAALSYLNSMRNPRPDDYRRAIRDLTYILLGREAPQ